MDFLLLGKVMDIHIGTGPVPYSHCLDEKQHMQTIEQSYSKKLIFYELTATQKYLANSLWCLA